MRMQNIHSKILIKQLCCDVKHFASGKIKECAPCRAYMSPLWCVSCFAVVCVYDTPIYQRLFAEWRENVKNSRKPFVLQCSQYCYCLRVNNIISSPYLSFSKNAVSSFSTGKCDPAKCIFSPSPFSVASPGAALRSNAVCGCVAVAGVGFVGCKVFDVEEYTGIGERI